MMKPLAPREIKKRRHLLPLTNSVWVYVLGVSQEKFPWDYSGLNTDKYYVVCIGMKFAYVKVLSGLEDSRQLCLK